MINYGLFVIIFFIAVGVSLIFTPLMRTIAIKLNILSRPGLRKIHTKPVPYLGGLAIYFSFIVSFAVAMYFYPFFKVDLYVQLMGIFTAGSIIVILGLWDDVKNMSPYVKLIGQMFVVSILFFSGLRIELLSNPISGGQIQLPLYLSIFFTFLWFLGLMNAMNLIDGLDGLAAGITVIVSGALIFIALYLGNYANIFLLVVLAGSCLGFLKYNFYPAKIFMGDCGSMFIGMILASIALMGAQHKAATAVVLLAPLSALAIPVYDIFSSIMRRLLNKQPVFRADKKHIHHRLLRFGLTQRQIVLFFYLMTLYLSVFAFLFVLIPEQYALVLLILLALGLFLSLIVVGFIESKLEHIHKI